MESNNNVAVLTSKVENFKVIARNALRMELISPRLSRVTDYENNINDLKESIKVADHNIVVEDYEIITLDSNHPNYKDRKEAKEARIKVLNEEKEFYNKEIVELEKAIADQKVSILKIETGETKVSLDSLNDLVNKMIKQDAYKQIA
jgi:hypothetical protein